MRDDQIKLHYVDDVNITKLFRELYILVHAVAIVGFYTPWAVWFCTIFFFYFPMFCSLTLLGARVGRRDKLVSLWFFLSVFLTPGSTQTSYYGPLSLDGVQI